METIFMNIENSKINESHKFALNLSRRLDPKCLGGNVTLQNLLLFKLFITRGKI